MAAKNQFQLRDFIALESPDNVSNEIEAINLRNIGNEVSESIFGYIQIPVLSYALNTPPALTNSGDAYVVGSTPTGDWVGQSKKIAFDNGVSWEFIEPQDRHQILTKTNPEEYYIFRGTFPAGSWVKRQTSSTLQGAYDNTIGNATVITNATIGPIDFRDHSTPIGGGFVKYSSNDGSSVHWSISDSELSAGNKIKLNGPVGLEFSTVADPIASMEGQVWYNGTELFFDDGTELIDILTGGNFVIQDGNGTLGNGQLVDWGGELTDDVTISDPSSLYSVLLGTNLEGLGEFEVNQFGVNGGAGMRINDTELLFSTAFSGIRILRDSISGQESLNISTDGSLASSGAGNVDIYAANDASIGADNTLSIGIANFANKTEYGPSSIISTIGLTNATTTSLDEYEYRVFKTGPSNYDHYFQTFVSLSGPDWSLSMDGDGLYFQDNVSSYLEIYGDGFYARAGNISTEYYFDGSDGHRFTDETGYQQYLRNGGIELNGPDSTLTTNFGGFYYQVTDGIDINFLEMDTSGFRALDDINEVKLFTDIDGAHLGGKAFTDPYGISSSSSQFQLTTTTSEYISSFEDTITISAWGGNAEIFLDQDSSFYTLIGRIFLEGRDGIRMTSNHGAGTNVYIDIDTTLTNPVVFIGNSTTQSITELVDIKGYGIDITTGLGNLNLSSGGSTTFTDQKSSTNRTGIEYAVDYTLDDGATPLTLATKGYVDSVALFERIRDNNYNIDKGISPADTNTTLIAIDTIANGAPVGISAINRGTSGANSAFSTRATFNGSTTVFKVGQAGESTIVLDDQGVSAPSMVIVSNSGLGSTLTQGVDYSVSGSTITFLTGVPFTGGGIPSETFQITYTATEATFQSFYGTYAQAYGWSHYNAKTMAYSDREMIFKSAGNGSSTAEFRFLGGGFFNEGTAANTYLIVDAAGARYNTDLSSVNSSNPRWIPDKAYVDSAGGTPGGSDTQLQYNSSSSFGGMNNVRYLSGVLVVDTDGTVAKDSWVTAAQFKGVVEMETTGSGNLSVVFQNQSTASGTALGVSGHSEGVVFGTVNTGRTGLEGGLVSYHVRANDSSIDIGNGAERTNPWSRSWGKDAAVAFGLDSDNATANASDIILKIVQDFTSTTAHTGDILNIGSWDGATLNEYVVVDNDGVLRVNTDRADGANTLSSSNGVHTLALNMVWDADVNSLSKSAGFNQLLATNIHIRQAFTGSPIVAIDSNSSDSIRLGVGLTASGFIRAQREFRVGSSDRLIANTDGDVTITPNGSGDNFTVTRSSHTINSVTTNNQAGWSLNRSGELGSMYVTNTGDIGLHITSDTIIYLDQDVIAGSGEVEIGSANSSQDTGFIKFNADGSNADRRWGIGGDGTDLLIGSDATQDIIRVQDDPTNNIEIKSGWDLEILGSSQGLILTDGTNRWRLTVDNTGTLTTTQL